ncbi:WD40 repeat-like protein [Ceratobasidium sp. AG-I]|nr:WD40 repeat-like protein [Ceratobasidium sp. AG-I]
MAARPTAPLLQRNAGSYVYSIAVSHDGKRVASGSHDGLVRVWHVHTGALVLALRGDTSWVRSVAWSRDDTRLVSGSSNNIVRIWDARTGAPIANPLRGHTGGVWSVAFSHDSSRIGSGSADKTIRVWDAHTGALIGEPVRGHAGEVNTMAFSTDNSRIVSGSDDRTVRIWDAHTGSLIGKPLRGHTASIWSVAFSHDSTRIVSGSGDSTIRIWDARTGALIGEPLRGHTGPIQSVAFSHDSTRIVSGSWDRTIHIWDARTGTPIGEPLRGHTNDVYSVAFSPDSTRIISGSWDHNICVWEAPPSTPSFDMVTSNMSVEDMFRCLVQHGCADISPLLGSSQHSLTPIANGGFGDVWRVTLSDGSVIAVKTLRLPKLLAGNAKGAKRAVREVHHWSKLRHLNVQELLGVVVFQGGLGMVSPWMENGHLKHYLAQRPEVPRYPLAPELFQPEGQNGEGGAESVASRSKATDTMLEIITGNVPYAEYRSDMGIYRAISRKKPPKQQKELSLPEPQIKPVWDLLMNCWNHDPSSRPDAASVLALLRWDVGSPVNSVAISHDGKLVASGSTDGFVRIWDAHTGYLVQGPLKGHVHWVRSVAWSHDDTRAVSGSSDDTIRIWDVRTGASIGKPSRGHTNAVFSVAFSTDSALIVSGSYDNTIRIWNPHTGAPTGYPLRGHTSPIFSVAFSSDGIYVASGSSDNTIRIWDTRTGFPIGYPFKGHTDSVLSVAFSPSDTKIVSGSADNTIRLWDVRTGTPIDDPLRGHTSAVLSASFSPDSSLIVSGSKDQTVGIWNSHTGVLIGEALNRDTNAVYSVAFSCDGTRIVSGSGDGAICVWITAPSTPSFDRVSSDMSIEEMFECLVQYGCADLSTFLGNGQYSSLPIDNGGFGDLWLVHGDLKANNVLVSNDGTLKINDFDHAVLAGSTLHFSTTTRAGGGTLRWMAPELLQSDEDDEEDETLPGAVRCKPTDIYALGMTMLEVVTGNVPYQEYQQDMGVYHAIDARQPPRRPQELAGPESQATFMWDLLMRCWDHDPLARPNAQSVLESLNSFAV